MLALGVTDEEILSSIDSVDRIAVDVPFGWPEPFVEFVLHHSDRSSSAKVPPLLDLRWRTTDFALFDATGLRPLSVSVDKIGATALRWAGIERQLSSRGIQVERNGSGRFIETYPTAALLRWGFPIGNARVQSGGTASLTPWLG